MLPQPHVVVIEGTEYVIPLVKIAAGRLPWKVYVGNPLGGYGVILTQDGAVTDPNLIAKCLSHLAQANVDLLELNSWPFAPVCNPNDAHYKLHETSVIDLINGADSALGQMSGNSRRMAGQAVRRGVKCAPETDSSVIDTYYDLLSGSAARWGLSAPNVPKKFLESLVHYGNTDVEIWIARYEGEAIAGAVVLYGSQEVNIWSAAMRGDMAVLRPHNILNVTLIRAAAERGMRWYNLGSSEGLPGVKKFKEGLGAKTVPYRTYVYQSPIYRIYSGLRSALTRSRKN